MKCLGENNFEDQKRYFQYYNYRYLSYINDIRNVTMLKLEEITAALCLFAEDLADLRAKDLEE